VGSVVQFTHVFFEVDPGERNDLVFTHQVAGRARQFNFHTATDTNALLLLLCHTHNLGVVIVVAGVCGRLLNSRDTFLCLARLNHFAIDRAP